MPDSCEMAARREEEVEWKEHINQLEKFYVQEMMELFNSSGMVAFYHSNPIARCNFRKAWQNARRLGGMELAKYNFLFIPYR